MDKFFQIYVWKVSEIIIMEINWLSKERSRTCPEIRGVEINFEYGRIEESKKQNCGARCLDKDGWWMIINIFSG